MERRRPGHGHGGLRLAGGGRSCRPHGRKCVVWGLWVVFWASLTGAPLALAQNEIILPAGPHRDLVYGKCRTCHDLQYVVDSKGMSRTMWDGLLGSMEEFGLEVNDPQRQQILDYLATYLGPNPPPAATQEATASVSEVNGGQIFSNQCIACHQASGTGVPGEFPPLAGNRDLFRSRAFPVLVLLYGLQGEIQVEGTSYNGVMPSFSHLSDAQIAAVINHVRQTWGNDQLRPADMAPLQTDDVTRARNRKLTASDVHRYRASHP